MLLYLSKLAPASYYSVDGLPHRTLFRWINSPALRRNNNNKQCPNDWMVSVEPKYYTYRLLND